MFSLAKQKQIAGLTGLPIALRVYEYERERERFDRNNRNRNRKSRYIRNRNITKTAAAGAFFDGTSIRCADQRIFKNF